jgi:uncharacterized membrane protein YgcG
VGVLVDERVQMTDITATAIDLAVKGYFSIKEIGKKGWLTGKSDYELTWADKSTAGLAEYQVKVLDMLFGINRQATVKLSKLPKNAYLKLNEAKEALYKQVTDHGLFTNSPQKVRTFYQILGVVIMGLAFVQAIFLSAWFNPLIAWICVFTSGLIVLLFSPFMPARTAKGRKLLAEVVGLKEWIRFGSWREKIHEKNLFLEEVLPYTIVFGMTERFLQAFSKSELANLNWYESADPRRMVLPMTFDSFERNLSGGVATTRPSGSGSSYGGYGRTGSSSGGSGFSGGSSGGGFGGGGGGSW